MCIRGQIPVTMAGTPLDNYLRTHRKKAGLSQEEASHLVGLKNRLQFARYERYQCEPPLRVALACEQVFGVPTAQLFAGVSTKVAKRTKRRVKAFERTLSSDSEGPLLRQLQHRLQWVIECLARLGRIRYGI